MTPLPAAAKRGTKVAVNFAGTQVEGLGPVEVQAPADPAVEAINVTPIGRGGLPGWPVTLLLSDHDEFVAGDGIGTMGQTQHLAAPCGVTGRFLHKSQKDNFVIAAKKRTAVSHRRPNSRTAITGRGLCDPAQWRRNGVDPHRPAPGAGHRLYRPGRWQLFHRGQPLNYSFGPCEVYRLTVTPPAPGFDLSLDPTGLPCRRGKALLPVTTLIRHEFGGPIESALSGRRV